MDLVRSVAFSQDGNRVVSGSNDKTIQIWNTTIGEVEAVLVGHTDYVSSVAFSQDGSQVVSGSEDKTIRIWNSMTGEMEAELKGHTGGVWCVAFSKDGRQVASGSSDKTVRIWNTMTSEMEAVLEGDAYGMSFVAFSHDGSQVVSASYDGTLWTWNRVTCKMQLKTTKTITLSDAGIVRNTLVKRGKYHIFYPEQFKFSIHGPLLPSDDCQWILGALYDCWIPSHNRDITTISFSGDRVCWGCSSGNVIIFDMEVAP